MLNQAAQIADQANEADQAGDHAQALHLYRVSLEHLFTIYKSERNETLKEIIHKKIVKYLERAETLKKLVGIEPKKKAVISEEDDNGKIKSSLSSTRVENPNVKWDDVAGLEGVKITLKETVILPQRFPQLFVGERKPWAGILLYGPPGTGKSFLAKAVATEASSAFFSVSSSDLLSKWQGDSERSVKQLFELARESSPAIIFVDEVDALCGTRTDGDNESSRRIKTEFLVQMDGVRSNTSAKVLVLGATNTPWTLDPAIRRRFEKRIYVPLPDENARTQIITFGLGKTPHTLTNFNEIAKQTEGFSGADIAVLTRTALMAPLKQAQQAVWFQLNEDEMYTPCITPQCTHDKCEQKTLMEIDPPKLKVRSICYDDFQHALKYSHASVSPQELIRFIEWTKLFGET